MPHPMTPRVMRLEGETRPVRAHVLPGTSIAAPAPFKKLRRVGRARRLESARKSVIVNSQVNPHDHETQYADYVRRGKLRKWGREYAGFRSPTTLRFSGKK